MPGPTPRPGPAPPDTRGFTYPGFDQTAAQAFLKATRWKRATKSEMLIATKNYEKNKKIEKEVLRNQGKEKYITNQSKLTELRFGTSNMGNAGCELIAIYNAILLKEGKKISLSKLIYQCEISGYTALTGQWGTNPYRIGKLITKSGMNYTAIKSRFNLKMKKGGVFIVSFWNSKNILKGIHTIAIKVKSKNRIKSYNDVYSDSSKTVKGTFKKLLKNRPFIIGYKMKGRRK